MHIHSLSCGAHCPIGGAFYDGVSRSLHANIPTRCLLVETAAGLVLVDTGYGLQDVSSRPERRLAHLWPLVLNPQLSEAGTAVRQVEAMGHRAADVRHIVLTHLDFDHAGGLEDFPSARVHVLASERQAATARRGFVGRQRYRPLDWDGVGEWRSYAAAGEPWHGFEAVRQLDGLPPEILMIPLAGHTAGHAGVAIDTPSGWLLHAGDAYLHHNELTRQAMPPGLALYERIMMAEPKAARRNLERLRALHAGAPQIRIVCSHDDHGHAALAAL